MGHLRRVLRVAVAALATAALVSSFAGSPVAAASPPLHGGGSGVLTAPPDITLIREAGGNRTEHRVLEGVVTGTLTGTFVQEVVGTVHANDRVTFRGTLVFTGTIDGCAGGVHTLTLRVTGRGDTSTPGFPITEATVTLIGPPGAVHVTGKGTVHQEGPFLSYQVTYKCH
jgi:hypothetical protein